MQELPPSHPVPKSRGSALETRSDEAESGLRKDHAVPPSRVDGQRQVPGSSNPPNKGQNSASKIQNFRWAMGAGSACIKKVPGKLSDPTGLEKKSVWEAPRDKARRPSRKVN